MDPLEYELDRWRGYSRMLGFAKPEQAEKDYLQELILLAVYSGTDSGLVFRGGTAIAKFYGSGRFSEDLDFVSTADAPKAALERQVEAAIRALEVRYEARHVKKSYKNMIRYDIKIKGPIYLAAGSEQAKQTVKIDLNIWEHALLPPESRTRVAIYEDLKPYQAVVADRRELLADKAKAMLERTRPMARDLFDAWLLVKRYGIRQDKELIERKISEYGNRSGERFSMRDLKNRIREMRKWWDDELSRLTSTVPNYGEVCKEFYASF